MTNLKNMPAFILLLLLFMQCSAANAKIMGGKIAERLEWVVLVVNDNAHDGCTGIALNASWVLTAKHCIIDTDIKSIAIHYSTEENNIPDKTGIPVDMKSISTPDGCQDLALLKLATAHELTTYAPIRYDYTAKAGDSAVVYGYAVHNDINPGNVPAGIIEKPLYRATVTVKGQPSTQILAEPVDGSTNQGDSGGPLLVGGKVVAVVYGAQGTGAPSEYRNFYCNAFTHPLFGSLQSWFEGVMKGESTGIKRDCK